MSLRLFAISALLALAPVVRAATGVEQTATTPILGTDTVHGCYSSLGELKLNGTDEFNSQGACAGACRTRNKNVAASNAKDCYCGDKYPPKNTLVDDSECTEPCPGYDAQACGGLNTYTVYNTGVKVSVADSDPVSSSSSASSSTATDTGAASSTRTSSSSAAVTSSSDDSSSGGTNTAGIAAGVVVGFVAIAGIAGGIFFFLRRRRNQEIEEEHRRNAAVNAFISGGKPPSRSGGLSISDQRLDPVMAQRRMSSGSIADNEDYSRRILRVTNA